jgi:F-type H+-transporting ATPase subunit b
MLTFPPDITFVIQIVSFLVLWFGLKRLLFDPMVQLLEERDRRTTGARAEAQGLNAAAESSRAEYERRLLDVRHALLADAETARHATASEEQRVLSEARREAGVRLAQLRESLGRQAEGARPALAGEARHIAARMLERVAGRALT